MESGKKFWTRIHIDFSGTRQGKKFLDYVEPFSSTLCFTPNMLQQIKFCTSYVPSLKIPSLTMSPHLSKTNKGLVIDTYHRLELYSGCHYDISPSSKKTKLEQNIN